MHQAARRAHREPDGKHQTKPHELAAGVFGDIYKIAAHYVDHVRRDEFEQKGAGALNVEPQHAEQRTDENQQRKDGKQQIIRQRRAVATDVMAEVAVYQLGNQENKSFWGLGFVLHGSPSSGAYFITKADKIKENFPLLPSPPPNFHVLEDLLRKNF